MSSEQNDYVASCPAGRDCPPKTKYAGVAELADAPDLGSGGNPCRFKSCHPHQKLPNEIHSGVFHMVYYSIIAVVNLSIIQLPLAVLFFRKEYTDCARQKQVCGKEISLCLTRHKSGKGFLNLEKQRI